MRLQLLDSFRRDAAETGLAWLLRELPGAERVRIGSGYFDAGVLDWLETPLADVLRRGGNVHLVLGSNRGQTSKADLARLLPLVALAPTRCVITVVYLPDVLYHPKVYYVQSPTRVAGLVGSPNLTVRGLAQNIEAAMSIEADTCEPPLDLVEAMLDPARYAAYPNAYGIASQADLDELGRLGVIDSPRAVAPPAPGTPATRRARGTARRIRFPPVPMIPGLPPLPRRTRGAVTAPVTAPAAPAPRPAPAAVGAGTTVVFVFAPNDLKLTGTKEISVPRAMRDWGQAVSGIPVVLGAGDLLSATVFARLAAAPSSVSQSPQPERLWVTGASGGTHLDVRFVLGNQVRRDLNSQAVSVFGDQLSGGEIGVLELPADPVVDPVRLTVYTPADADYAALNALAVRTPPNTKRQAVVSGLAFLPRWPF
jgi:hypothetical protein